MVFAYLGCFKSELTQRSQSRPGEIPLILLPVTARSKTHNNAVWSHRRERIRPYMKVGILSFASTIAILLVIFRFADPALC